MPWGESLSAQGNVDALNQKIIELACEKDYDYNYENVLPYIPEPHAIYSLRGATRRCAPTSVAIAAVQSDQNRGQ